VEVCGVAHFYLRENEDVIIITEGLLLVKLPQEPNQHIRYGPSIP
jgi:hypothetical protein